MDISQKPFVKFDVKTDSSGQLFTSFVGNKYYNEITRENTIIASDEYETIFLSFYNDYDKLKENIRELKFYMNDDEPYEGNLFIDNLKIGNAIEYPLLAVNSTNYLLTSNDQVVEVDIYNLSEGTTMEWTVEFQAENSDSSWVKLLDSNNQPVDFINGVNDKTISLECSANKSSMPRKAELTVTHDSLYHMSETITLTQLPQNDFALAIDRSKSMDNHNRLESVKESAKGFISLLTEKDNIAVTSFNENGTVDFELEQAEGSVNDDASSRYRAMEAIENIKADGYTSIGKGIDIAQKELNKTIDSLTEDKHQNMILISDGYENFPPLFHEYFSEIHQTTQIYTIGLSELVNYNLLSYIANKTDANYIFSPAHSQLRKIYSFLHSKSKNQEIIDIQEIELTGYETKEYEIPVDPTMQILNINILHPGDEYDLKLFDPFHKEYNDTLIYEKENILYYTDEAYYTTYYINKPEPGIWKAVVTKTSGTSNENAILISGGYAVTDSLFQTNFSKDHYKPGEDIVIKAKMYSSAHYSIFADVLYPVQSYHFDLSEGIGNEEPLLFASEDGQAYLDAEGDTIYKTKQIELNDEGIGYDSIANDGIYTGSFSETDVKGSYTFEIKATSDSTEAFFERYDMKSVVVADEKYNEEHLNVTVPGDFYSIQEAIDSVYSWGGGIVYVKEGTYYENITNHNTVWVIGEGDPAKTFIDGGNRHNVVIMDSVVEGGIIGFTIRNSQQNGNFAGIKMTGSQTPVVANCIFRDNRHGMFIAGDVRAFIANNLIFNNNRDGIRISGSSQSVIVNNIIMNNNRGLIANGQPVKISGYNNIWSNNLNYHKIEPGKGSISVDPEFKDYHNDDFRLSQNSPCIDAGHYKIPDTDATRSDIGVYGGLHKYWRNLFISKELVLEDNGDDYVFGDTGVSICNDQDNSTSKSTNDNRITVSKFNEKLFLEDQKQKSVNSLWNIYSTEAVENNNLRFEYDEKDISENDMIESQLVLAKYNINEQEWNKLKDSHVDIKNKQITAEVSDISGYWTIMETAQTDTSETNIQTINEYIEFIKVYPNPSDGREINIRFSLSEEIVMGIHIYNSKGKYITRLSNQDHWKQGEHTLQWNGTDSYGSHITSDVYIIIFNTKKGTESIKAIIIN